MRERLIVSGGDALQVYTGWNVPPCMRAELRGAGALCAGDEVLYVACGRAEGLWRLDARTLMPTGLFTAGPGVCRLLLSGDGSRLYALCAEADSVLMLDARSGVPLVLCPVGLSPADMAMDGTGSVIAVAGGLSGEVVLLCAQSLHVLSRLRACGPVLSVALGEEAVYAFCLSDSMNAVLTTFTENGKQELPLAGMPGALCSLDGALAAATQERLYWISPDGRRVLRSEHAPGRAGRLLAYGGGLVMTDVWSDALFAFRRGNWRCMNLKAADLCVSRTEFSVPDENV